MKVLFFIIALMFIISPAFVFAQPSGESPLSEKFEAQVLQVLEQKEMAREDGSEIIQQNLRLKGLSGQWKNKEMIFQGISNLEIISAGTYKKGDRVVVNYYKDGGGLDVFYVVDYVRRGYLYLLAAFFSIIVIFIGKWKGIKALLGLAASFFVIMKFIIPKIFAGGNPLSISLIGSFTILAVLIYFTDGWNKNSHVAILSISISLILTLILSVIFTNLTRLTGLAQEEAVFLVGAGKIAIDFEGLLLAGILIGTLGVLDDGVVSQIEAVEQIRTANPGLSKLQIFKSAFAVGNTHLGAIINTLFLTYAGASLPLLLLFNASNQGYGSILNNEAIATELVRTLVGSIGVAMALPVATFLASYFLVKKRKHN